MTGYVRPTFVTERETSHLWVDERTIDNAAWEDCGPCTALMACNAHAPGTAPATHYEEESLRMDAGYGAFGGTNVPNLCAGISKRYGIATRQVGGYAAFLAAMTPGHVAFAILQPSKLPASHFLRANVGTGFTALHFVYLAREGTGRYWLIDPAAAPGIGYTGQWITEADIKTCYVGGAGVLTLAEDTLAGFKITVPSPVVAGVVAIPKGTKAYSLADGSEYVVPQSVSRDASTALSAPGSRGYLVTLDGEGHFVYATGLTFSPNGPATSKLVPGVFYEVA